MTAKKKVQLPTSVYIVLLTALVANLVVTFVMIEYFM
jgi:hypothetical protein